MFVSCQGVQAGKSGSGDEKSLADQLADANAALGKMGTEATQIRMRITHLEKELKDKKAQLLSKQKEVTTAENELQSRRAEVEKISAALGSIKFDEKHMDSLEKVVCYQVFVEDGNVVGPFALNLFQGPLELTVCSLFLRDT